MNKQMFSEEIIVTGATGYLGFVFINKLIESGYSNIKVLIRSEKSRKKFINLPISCSLGDLMDQDFINKEITTGSVVFHLAGLVNIESRKSKEIYNVNINATKNIVDACIKNNAKKLIYVSSTSVIDASSKNTLLVEPTSFNYKKLVGHYAKSKAEATNYILEKAKSESLNAVVLYPSAIIGPYDYNISSMGQVVIDYMNNKLPAYVKGRYNFVDVRDVADALIKAYEIGKANEGYIITSESLTVKEMLLILNKHLGKTKLPIKLPLWFLKLFALFAEAYYLVRNKIPILSRTSLKILNMNSNFSNEKAKKDLNFKPIPAGESFLDMINWFKDNKQELLTNKKN